MCVYIYVYTFTYANVYARMIVILAPAMPDISDFVCDLHILQMTFLFLCIYIYIYIHINLYTLICVYTCARMIAIPAPAMPAISEIICDLRIRQVTCLSII